MSDSPAFGIQLKQRRAALDLTQEALAERVGCAAQTIRKIESGERRPSRDMAERLAQVLELGSEERATFIKMARTALEPAQTLEATPTVQRPATRNLPKYTRTFVGRTAELTQLGQLMTMPSCQLITLVGPGGIGKTRLAIEAAAHCEQFADGVVFVSLASVEIPSLIVPAIADALSFTFYGSEEPGTQLLSYLREKELLLILDNMEQLLDGAEQLIELLSEAHGVKLIVTSRERLNVQGEWVVELAGLPVSSDAAASADATALFVERARRVQHGFEVTEADLRTVYRICCLVDGMPLAIELAASWVRMLSLVEIEQEIANSFDILSTSTRDVPGRHQSLRAVFEHSWRLLSDEERRVLCRLTVFRGGFDRAAAVAVVGASLPVLAALVDKSLLRQTTPTTGTGSLIRRYDLHELVRQYATTYLAADTEAYGNAHDRHCNYYISWLESRIFLLQGREQVITIAEMSQEIDNLRASWTWATSHHKLSEMERAHAVLHWFYEYRTWYVEGEATFQQAAAALKALSVLAAGQTKSSPALYQQEHEVMLGQMLGSQGYFALRSGQLERARDILRQSLELLRASADQAVLAAPLTYQGIVAYQMGAYEEAHRILQEGLAISTQAHNHWVIALNMCFLGATAHAQGNYEQARQLFRDDLAVWRSIDNVRGISLCLNYYSTTLYKLQEYADAQALLHESLELCSASGDRWGLGTALNHLGLVAQAQGQYHEAHYLFSEGLTLFREMGNRWDIARTLNHLGEVAWELKDWEDARRSYLAALRTGLEAKATPAVLTALGGLALVHRREGSREQALELCYHILQHPASGKETYERAERLYLQLVAEVPVHQRPIVTDQLGARPFDLVVGSLVAMRATHVGAANRSFA